MIWEYLILGVRPPPSGPGYLNVQDWNIPMLLFKVLDNTNIFDYLYLLNVKFSDEFKKYYFWMIHST